MYSEKMGSEKTRYFVDFEGVGECFADVNDKRFTTQKYFNVTGEKQ